ncbi:hypothetical protein E4U54_003489 [Claviceps lovelessii]|nr:hypothetical protein E4U54_003489 [Claviceps lovelessii]
MSAGSLTGALLAGWLADRLGRRGAWKVASVIWVLGATMQCSAQNVPQLIAGESSLASALESRPPRFLCTLPSWRRRRFVDKSWVFNNGPSNGSPQRLASKDLWDK